MSLRPGRSSRSLLAFALSAALFAMPAPGGAPPLDGSFTYQGRLMEAGEPANGSFDFQFSLWQDVSAGTQTGSTIAVDGLAVTDGLVQANLDFGVGFTSSRRWLEVAVRPAGSPDPYTTLAPRRELVATPQATFAVDAADAANAALLDGIDSLGFATAAHAHSSIQTSSGNSSVVLSDIGRYLVGGTNNAATAANAGAIGGANNAAGGSNSATVGGDSLTASGVNAVAIGGFENAATGQHSIALGGADNGANGDYSLAGGRGSVVSGDGTFAWADSTNASFNSTIDNAFLIRAANGVGINTTTPGAKLHVAGTAGADGIMFPDGTLQTTAFTGGMAGNSLDAADGSPTEAVYVDNDGRVGIGTLAPSAGLHVASSSSGDASMPELLATLIDGAGGFDGLNGPRSMLVSGNRLYVASSADNAMSILDISDPAAPVQLGSVVDGVGGFTRLAGANSVAVSGNTAFVAATTDNALTIIDVANPAAPLLLAELVDGAGGFNRLAGALFVAVSGTTAIVAAGTPDHALTLIDVSNPAAPTLLAELVDGQGGFNRLQGANVVRISGTTAYASAQNDDALTLIDISNPASPALLAEIVDGVGGFARLDGCNHVFVDGTIAYATASIDDALTIVDVSNPASPALLATVVNGSGAVDNMSGPLAVAAADGVAYVAAATSDAVTILDVSNPSSPFLLGELVDGVDGLDRLQGARHVAVSGSNVFVAAFTDDAITVLRRGSLSAFFEDGVSIGGSLSVAEGAAVQGGLGVGGPAPAAGLDVEGGDLELSGNYLLLSNNGDAFDGLGVRRGVNPFAGLNVGGPVLWGEGGGALGSNDQVDGEAIALRWLDSGNVGIGLANPTAKLHVGGTAGSDGIRFPDGTLQTTAFTGGGVGDADTLDGIDSLGFATAAHTHSSITNGASSVTVSGTGRSVVGGTSNSATAANSVAVGGSNNNPNGAQSVILGGSDGGTSGVNSAILGGNGNLAAQLNSVVLGGASNIADGSNSATLAGSGNSVSGDYSVAAGRRASVEGSGTFAWSDNSVAVDFDSTLDNAFLIRAANGVGINTADPQASLHVAGTAGSDGIMFPDGTLQTTAFTGGGVGDADTLDGIDSSGFSLAAHAHSTLEASDGSHAVALTIDAEGDVGIGTTSTPLSLNVEDDNTPGVRLEQTDGAFGSYTWDLIANEVFMAFRDVTAGARLPFKVEVGAATNTLVVDGASRVGIGTSSPAQTLDVVGSAAVSGAMTVDASTFQVDAATNRVGVGTSPVTELHVRQTGDSADNAAAAQFGLLVQKSSFAVGDESGIAFQVTDNPSATVPGAAITHERLGSDDLGALHFKTKPSSGLLATRMTIDEAGEVGIGTTTPSSTLQVVGTAAISGNTAIDTTTLVVDSVNDRVGIGTNAPASPLHVLTMAQTAIFAQSSATTGSWISLRNTSTGGVTADIVSTGSANGEGAGNMLFRLNNSTRMVLDGNNNRLAVHRTSAAHPLQVGTDATNGNGAHVTAGGAWTNGSSRAFKTNFRDLDPLDVLNRVVGLSIQRWEYDGSDEGDHVGPVAEEFHAAFGLGVEEQYIATVDADGVALAAIQGLNAKLEAENAALRAENAALEARLARIESILGVE